MTTVQGVRPLRTVIVDDTADLRTLLRLALARGGFDVVAEAGDGQEGIDVVRQVRPDVVLLDLSMPVMDGLEALPTIRRLLPKAKIIVLSGFGATQMSARALAAGADGYVQKGSSLTAILEYVRGVAGTPARPTRTLSVVPPPAPELAAEVAATRAAASPSGEVPVAPPAAAARAAADLEPAAVHQLRRAAQAPLESGPPERSAPAGSQASSWEALSMAPFGILELADEPLFRVVYANNTAQRLLAKPAAPGTPLSLASSELASLVAFHRLDADASFDVHLDGGTARATLRRTGWSVMVYLDSGSDDVALLRRAIATTAHEIRGPVAVICGIAETIGWSKDALDAEHRDRLMESVARQARMLDSITADLLTAAQIQRGTLRVDLQAVSPLAAVESVVRDRYDVEVVVEDDRRVQADPLRLEQMLSNLVGNAHKYGRAPFVVRVRAEGEDVAIDVEDHGDGVPEGFQDQLFREFARAQGTVATGTGLGLYVVRTLAEAQGGTVSHSTAPHGGAVFTVRLRGC